jgi:hypothetical protein
MPNNMPERIWADKRDVIENYLDSHWEGETEYVRADVAKAIEESKNMAYRERNQIVSALSKHYPSYLAKHKDTGQNWDPEWCNIVYIEGPTGQMGWHIHESDLDLFVHLEWKENNWDGHDTPEKYRRLAAIDQSEVWEKAVARERELTADMAAALACEAGLNGESLKAAIMREMEANENHRG